MAARRWTPSNNVLLLLCLMYFITYVDRVNVSTAAAAFKAGDWSLPFYGAMALLLAGIGAAFWMRPDRTFAADALSAIALKQAPTVA